MVQQDQGFYIECRVAFFWSKIYIRGRNRPTAAGAQLRLQPVCLIDVK